MVYFNSISPQTWEHPADNVALNVLKQIKGFDQLLKYFISITNERQEKLKLLSTCIKASEKNYPKLYEIMKNTSNIFGWDFTPDIFVKNDEELNAYTSGVKEPYIVVRKTCLEEFSDEEIASIVGHEMGHIMSGHVLYKSMLDFVVDLTVSKVPRNNLLLNQITLPFIGITLKPLELALAAWSRKSELTADRAGLLASQNVEVCHRLQLRLAGFNDSSNIDLDDLYKQAVEYDSYNSTLDNLYKINNYESHPDSIIRIKELETWVSSGKYQEIINGNYLKRDGMKTKLIAGENKKFCGNCGKKIPQVKFCPYCGNKI